MWDVEERGFLPNNDPIVFLPVTDIRNTELVHTWENLSHILPEYLKEDCVREELICSLRKVSHSYYHGCIDNLGGPSAHERTFLLLAYFSTAYINSPEGKRKSKLPKEIVVPFARVAHLVGRAPALDYTSFVLYNWKVKDVNKDLTRNNIQILQTFTDSEYEHDILTSFVEMESIGFELIRNISNPFIVSEKLVKINKLLQKTRQNIPLEFLIHWNDLLSDYKNIKYEQWQNEPLSFSCDISLQSPILSLIYQYLNISFNNDLLRKKQKELQMPSTHRNFINNISGIRIKCAKYDYTKEVYNNCLNELITLRKQLQFRSADVDETITTIKELSSHYL